jgi:hypothetical protein
LKTTRHCLDNSHKQRKKHSFALSISRYAPPPPCSSCCPEGASQARQILQVGALGLTSAAVKHRSRARWWVRCWRRCSSRGCTWARTPSAPPAASTPATSTAGSALLHAQMQTALCCVTVVHDWQCMLAAEPQLICMPDAMQDCAVGGSTHLRLRECSCHYLLGCCVPLLRSLVWRPATNVQDLKLAIALSNHG